MKTNLNYCCPICKDELILVDKQWKCDKNHSFDIARESYVNLLPVQQKNSKNPGDNLQMLSARRNFLTARHYQHLSDRINQLAIKYTEQQFDKNSDIKQVKSILDIGCGEGYYSNRLFNLLNQNTNQEALTKLVDWRLYGIDISKIAIKMAAKSYPNLEFCVANSYQLPFADDSFDLALLIYAPLLVTELQRVMRQNAIFIRVSAGAWHHFAVKKIIYDNPQLHNNDEVPIEGFRCLLRENMRSDMLLESPQDISNFLEMTPYAWKLTNEKKSQLCNDKFSCELDFLIEVYQKI